MVICFCGEESDRLRLSPTIITQNTRPICLLGSATGVSDCRTVSFIRSPFRLRVFLGSVLVAVAAAPCLFVVVLRHQFPFFAVLVGFVLVAAAVAIGAPAAASSDVAVPAVLMSSGHSGGRSDVPATCRVHVTEGATVEPNPEVGAPFEEVVTETWEVSEGPSQLCNQGKPRMH
ncbi:hypothetical protein BDA96_10G171100 [Sorghum bicolor]|uniref:Uncharacterized protein n=1 Tax=Sorghum bicolor TaxID=4558 RepID=A0A921U0K3_SORBI|nr:hypothetical protein BDA96_10G171100 [Sorghum bicolor]